MIFVLPFLNVILAAVNIGLYADSGEPLNLGVGVFCGLTALLTGIAASDG